MSSKDQEVRRLGKRELGTHAFEPQMPAKLAVSIANEDASNALPGVIPNLARLLEHNKGVEKAYLCTEHAVQVFKLEDEGNHFCGYRNIQMLWWPLSCLDPSDDNQFSPYKPAIPALQNMVERAWDAGFNSYARILTGGIKGTRKHIGTSEAEALLLSNDVPCTGRAYHGKYAWQELLDATEAYFAASVTVNVKGRVYQSDCLPMFLQRPKHSLTIVGIGRTASGKRWLLVFDPAWQPPSKMRKSLDPAECSGLSAKLLLKRYRKSEGYLKRFKDFETLEIDKLQ